MAITNQYELKKKTKTKTGIKPGTHQIRHVFVKSPFTIFPHWGWVRICHELDLHQVAFPNLLRTLGKHGARDSVGGTKRDFKPEI